MSVITAKAGLLAAMQTLKPSSFRSVLNGEPNTVHNLPLCYLESRNGERTNTPGVTANVYRIAVCVCVAKHDNTNAEDEIDALVNLIPATVDLDNTLGGAVGTAVGESWDADDFVIADTLTRRLTWVFRITDKGGRKGGL